MSPERTYVELVERSHGRPPEGQIAAESVEANALLVGRLRSRGLSTSTAPSGRINA